MLEGFNSVSHCAWCADITLRAMEHEAAQNAFPTNVVSHGKSLHKSC